MFSVFNKISDFFKNLYNKIFSKKLVEKSIECDTKDIIHSKVENNVALDNSQNITQEGLETEDDIMLEYLTVNDEWEDYEYEIDENYAKENSKEKAFQLYSDIKNNMRTIESLNIVELIQINALLKEEKKLKGI